MPVFNETFLIEQLQKQMAGRNRFYHLLFYLLRIPSEHWTEYKNMIEKIDTKDMSTTEQVNLAKCLFEKLKVDSYKLRLYLLGKTTERPESVFNNKQTPTKPKLKTKITLSNDNTKEEITI